MKYVLYSNGIKIEDPDVVVTENKVVITFGYIEFSKCPKLGDTIILETENQYCKKMELKVCVIQHGGSNIKLTCER